MRVAISGAEVYCDEATDGQVEVAESSVRGPVDYNNEYH